MHGDFETEERSESPRYSTLKACATRVRMERFDLQIWMRIKGEEPSHKAGETPRTGTGSYKASSIGQSCIGNHKPQIVLLASKADVPRLWFMETLLDRSIVHRDEARTAG